MKYSEKEMAALINEVETQFADHLKKAEDETKTVELKKNEVETEVETEVELNKSEEFNYDTEDYVEMDEMYNSMSKAEKEAHYESIKKTLNVTEMAKSENVEVNDLMKSENTGLKTENEDLKKSLSKLTVAMADFIKGKAPKRKAVTNLEYVAKSETKTEEKTENKVDLRKLSKNEISAKLTAKIRNGLEKAERNKINQYYDGEININEIKHLL